MNIGIDPDLQGEKGDDILEVVQEVEIGHVLGIEGHVLGSIDIEGIDPETVDTKFYIFYYYFIFFYIFYYYFILFFYILLLFYFFYIYFIIILLLLVIFYIFIIKF